jgi:hypothetical protein
MKAAANLADELSKQKLAQTWKEASKRSVPPLPTDVGIRIAVFYRGLKREEWVRAKREVH